MKSRKLRAGFKSRSAQKKIPLSVFVALFQLVMLAPMSLVSIEAALGQPSQGSITIRGRVISKAGFAIAEAEVSLVGTTKSVLTDSLGSFALSGLPSGDAVLRVRRIGFKGQFLRVPLSPGESRSTEIMLEPGPQLLPEISVSGREAKPIEFAWTTKYDDFFRRQRLGLPGGTFVSGDDIKRRTAIHTYQLLEQYVPGARVIVHCLGGECVEVQFPRCSRAVGYVGVWVDGKRLNWQGTYEQGTSILNKRIAQDRGGTTPGWETGARERNTELGDVLELIPPNEIQFMEVYRGIASIPAEYSGGCGAIVIWTK